MNPIRRPTLHDVARLAGVSHMTVSRVVRGDRVVRAATLERVRAAIEQIGYRADPALAALAAYRSRSRRRMESTIAFLDVEPDGFSQKVYDAAQTEAERLGYAMERHEFPDSIQSQTRLQRQLYHRGVRGLLIGPSTHPPRFARWDWSSFAAIALGALFPDPPLHSVTTDYFSGAVQAMNHLHDKGCRRIGFAVRAELESRTAHRWIGGYLASRRDERPRIFSGNPSSASALRRWMQVEKLDGLLTIHREVWTARSAKILTVFLNPFECPPDVPCLVYDSQQIGIEGVRLMHHQWLNHEFGLPAEIKTVSLQPTLRRTNSPRETIPPPA